MRYLYTGDFKTQADDSAEPFVPVDRYPDYGDDVADPAVVHPDAVQEILRVQAMEMPVVIGTHNNGQGQRITRLLSGHCAGKRVFVECPAIP